MDAVSQKSGLWKNPLKSFAELASNYLPAGSAVFFSLRTILATSLALLGAFKMQLESPYWAAVTVWVVAHPHPTQTWGKGFFRIVGTLVGAVFAVVLTALFAQTPELFILMLALWSGLCTALANFLKNFHSYAVMLAGYTAAIVAVAAVNDPLRVFEIAVARGTCVMLGVAAVSIVSVLFHREPNTGEAPQVAKIAIFHPNYREASIGALRAFIATCLAGLFWIATGSSTGSGVLLMTAIMCSLFSTHPLPHDAIMGFIVAIFWASVAAFICLYFLVQRVEIFPLLMLCLAVFLLPGGIAMANPKTAFFGMGFSVNFVSQLQPANPMTYDIVTFLNSSLSTMAGSYGAALAFVLIFPRKQVES